MKAARKLSAPVGEEAAVSCAWHTGTRRCGILVSAGTRCQWHQHWMRLVDAGVVGRDQSAEFCEWWEQFQPWGVYAMNPGPWWADVALLWTCLIGLGVMPVLTAEISGELYLRRAQVRRYLHGLPWPGDPWPRHTELSLPPWQADAWQAKVDALKTTTAPTPVTEKGGCHAA